MNLAKRLSNSTLKEKDKNKKSEEKQTKPKNKFAIGMVSACAAVIVVLIALICWEDLHPRVIYTVNGENVYLSDMMYDIATQEAYGQQMDQYYSQMGNSFWTYDNDGMTQAEVLKDNILESSMETSMLYTEAVNAGYTLTDEEISSIESKASTEFDQFTPDMKKRTGLTKDKIVEILKKQSIADKYKDAWIETFNIDKEKITSTVSPEEYRQYDIQYYYIPYTSTDEEGNTVEMTPDERKAAKKELKASYNDIFGLEDFSTYVDNATDEAAQDASTPTATPVPGPKAPEGSRIQFKEANILEKDTPEATGFDEVLLAQIKMMENETIMDKVLEDTNGCYIIKMLNNDSKEAYDNECTRLIEDAKSKEYEEQIGLLEAEKYTIELKEDEWEKIEIGKVTIN